MFEAETADFRRGSVVELRAIDKKGGLPTLTGYAAVYDSWSEPLPSFGGMFREKISTGAFDQILRGNPDVRAFREHNPENVLGRTPKTLRLKSDRRGLRIEIDPPDTQLGRDTVELVRRGDLDGMSFGFRVDPDGASWNDDGSERVINEVAELLEVSIVSFPAYTATVASVTRSMADDRHDQAIAMKLEQYAQRSKRLGERLRAV